MKRRTIFLVGAATVGTAALGEGLRPDKRASSIYPKIDLETQVPTSFGEWSEEKGMTPILPDPTVQAALFKIYGQVLARTYRRATDGRRVMLSIAYGEDQGTDATAAHRPEFCYSAQGFSVSTRGKARFQLANERQLDVQRVFASMGPRQEHIIYWLTLNDTAILPGVERKLNQIIIGLGGVIPDGLLMRVSSIGISGDEELKMQQHFCSSLYTAISNEYRARYFGRTV